MTIGARMRAYRDSIGLTRDQFGERFGISPSTLSGYERDQRDPHASGLVAFAKAGANVNWLLTGEGLMSASSAPDRTPDRPYASGGEVRPMFASEPQSSQKADTLDPVLLQQVVDFFYRWLDGHQVRIARKKHGAVISVLYRIAKTRGAVVEDELAQVLGVAA